MGIRLRPKKNLYFYGGIASEITHGVGTADYRAFLGARFTPQLFGGAAAEVQEQTTEVPEPQIEEPMIEEPIMEDPIVEAPAVEEYVAPAADEAPQETIVAKSIHFKSGSHTQVLKSSRSEVVRIGNLLKESGFGRLKIVGHTDSQGSAASNQGLSERRANITKGYLVRKHGFNADSIFTEGMGETKPIDTNETPQGRKNNRRVEFQIFQ